MDSHFPTCQFVCFFFIYRALFQCLHFSRSIFTQTVYLGGEIIKVNIIRVCARVLRQLMQLQTFRDEPPERQSHDRPRYRRNVIIGVGTK